MGHGYTIRSFSTIVPVEKKGRPQILLYNAGSYRPTLF